MSRELQGINPNNINVSGPFFSTVWQNCEKETIARNIVMINEKDNLWCPFTWEQYCEKCSHQVTSKEKGILNSFVQEGYLSLCNGEYDITDKFLNALKDYFKS